MMVWIIEIKPINNWLKISQDGKPYLFKTEADALKMAKICYPDYFQDKNLIRVKELGGN